MSKRRIIELENRLNELEYQITFKEATSLSTFLFGEIKIPRRKPKIFPEEDSIHYRGESRE